MERWGLGDGHDLVVDLKIVTCTTSRLLVVLVASDHSEIYSYLENCCLSFDIDSPRPTSCANPPIS